MVAFTQYIATPLFDGVVTMLTTNHVRQLADAPMICRVVHKMSLEDLTDLERELLRRSD